MKRGRLIPANALRTVQSGTYASFPAIDVLAFPLASAFDSALELSMPNLRPIHSPAAISRSRFLQVGFSGALGLGLADLATGRKASAAMESNALFGRAKSVVLVPIER